MAERNEFIMGVKSERNFERTKLKFEFCRLMFDLVLEITEAYDEID